MLLGSTVSGRLAEQLAEDPRAARAILGDDVSWDLGLRLFAAVHHHVLTGIWPEPARLVAVTDDHGNWIDWLDPA